MILEGKRALVTGGTRGIGRAIAERFCEEGARVVVTGRASGNGRQAAESLRAQGYDISFAPVDMADVAAIRRGVVAAAVRLSGIDVLVNNAGITGRGTIQSLDAEEWDLRQAVNLRGPVFCMQAARPFLRKQGSIITIASIAGIDAPYGTSAYAAAKAGLIAASQVAAKEFAPQVRVNVIAPGLIETDMLTDMPPKYKDEFVTATPLQRTGTPEEIANACVFLASDQSSYTTGQVLRVDGGLHF